MEVNRLGEHCSVCYEYCENNIMISDISISLVFLLAACVIGPAILYAVPQVRFDALKSGGFRAYVQDIPGTSIFGFYANINEEITSRETGTINKLTNITENGYWVVEFPNQVKAGDVVHYRVFVTINGLGYRKGRLTWKVQDLVDSYPPFKADCVRASTVINGGTPTCINQVILDENFNHYIFFIKEWLVEQYIPTYVPGPRNEFNTYENSDKVFIQTASVLNLKPIIRDSEQEVRGEINLNDKCTSLNEDKCFHKYGSSFLVPPVKSARLTTQTSFKYGKIDVFAKLPTGDWLFPIIQLQLQNDEKEDSPTVWIAYSRGNDYLTGRNQDNIGSRVIFAGPVLHPEEPGRSRKLVSQVSDTPYSSQFHLYTLIWKPGEMTFFIDSQKYGTVNLTRSFVDPYHKYGHDWTTPEAPFDKEYVLSLGVGVAGISDFPDDSISANANKPWRNGERNQVKKFFDARNTWSKTWQGNDAALQLDYVKITAV